MRVTVDRPLLLLRSALADITHVLPITSTWETNPHLADIRVLPREMWGKPLPEGPIDWLDFPTLSSNEATTRLVLATDDREFDVRAVLPPVDGVTHTLMMLDVSNTVLVCIETEMSDRDGVMQLRGAEPTLMLIPAAEVRAQKGRTLLRGPSLRSFRPERRAGDGWEQLPLTFNPAAVGLRSLSEE